MAAATRSQAPPAAPPQPDLDPQGTPPASEARHGDASPVTVELRLEGVVLDESSLATSPMLPYVRMVVSLIEGVEFTCREVLDLLRQAMRQHSIGARREESITFWVFCTSTRLREHSMREIVELSSLDLRYEGHRLRDDAREARLLASIAERGIEEPLGRRGHARGPLPAQRFQTLPRRPRSWGSPASPTCRWARRRPRAS